MCVHQRHGQQGGVGDMTEENGPARGRRTRNQTLGCAAGTAGGSPSSGQDVLDPARARPSEAPHGDSSGGKATGTAPRGPEGVGRKVGAGRPLGAEPFLVTPALHNRPMDLLDGLDASQLHAVTVAGGPLCILAPAGSGKTRVLTRRVARRIVVGEIEAEHTLVVTFTRKAATELVARLGSLGVRERVATGTFHAIAWSTLRQRFADISRDPPVLLDQKARLIAAVLGSGRKSRGASAGDIAGEIEWAKARLIAPERYEAEALAAGRRPPLPAGEIADVYRRYEERKRKDRFVDFDDLLDLVATAMERDETYAASQRWRFRHFFVDEFQDVNPAQHRLLEAWRGGRPDLCVVGDPNQAIYGWNGADPSFLTDISRWYPGSMVVRLTHNYRSTPQIVAAADRVLKSAGDRTPSPVAVRPDGAFPAVHSFADELAEARGIATLFRDRGGASRSWSRFAVLTRTNAQLVPIERVLRAGAIPCRLRGGTPLLEQPLVVAWRRTAARRATTPLTAALADLDEQRSEAGPVEADDARVGALDALIALGYEMLADEPTASVASFLAWLAATLRDGAVAGGEPAVELTTFHAAKGLEWPIVVIAGMEQGLVPISSARGEARAEEVRLLHVALTRAATEVHLTWAKRRTFGARPSERSPSPLLTAIGVPPPDGPVIDLRRAVRTARRPAATTDDPLLARLKTWRSATARAADVPAFVVFADATLQAVAEHRPRTLAQLRALPGIGPVKVTRYGNQLLALVDAEGSA